MPERYLLDTNILSELIRHPAAFAQKLTTVGQDRLCTSVIVACEIRFGARKKGSPILSNRVEQLLDALTVLPLESGVGSVYADIRCSLESKGRPIGANDTLIAAHAIQCDCVLVTRNLREFRRVPDLRVENWAPRSRH